MSDQSTPSCAPRQSPEILPAAPGTYRLVDVETGRFYIGSSCNLRKRWKNHVYRLGRGTHPNPILQALWNVNPDRLLFVVTEQLPGCSTEAILAAEQVLLDAAGVGRNRRCMNILTVAGSHFGRKRSPQTRERLSIALRGRRPDAEARAKMRAAKIGRPLSPEHRRKIGQSLKGQPGRRPGAEGLSRLRRYTPQQVASFRALVVAGTPVLTAAKMLGISRSTARRIAEGESYVD